MTSMILKSYQKHNIYLRINCLVVIVPERCDSFVFNLNMRSLFSSIFFFTTLLTFFYIKPIETISENSVINDSRIQGSCMMSRNNFNRSCIYHKIVYLFHKFPSISGWSIFRVRLYIVNKFIIR